MTFIDNNQPIEIEPQPPVFATAQCKCNSPLALDPAWIPIEDAYNKYFLNYNGPKTESIPPILHQIWLGGTPLPDKCKRLADMWRELHPNWAYKLWTEKEVNELGMTNQRLYEAMRNPSAKSDVVRYEVLYSYGGVYLDTDYYAVKSLDFLRYLNFFAGVIGSYNGRRIDVNEAIVPGMIGCSQGNGLIGDVIKKIASVNMVPTTIPEIMTVTGPAMFSKHIAQNIAKHPMSVVLPSSYFYPFSGALRETIRNLSIEELKHPMEHFTHQETAAIHLYYCSWQKQNLL